jgi:hypothetical protein
MIVLKRSYSSSYMARNEWPTKQIELMVQANKYLENIKIE